MTTEGLSMLFAAAIIDVLIFAFDLIGIFTGIGLILSKFIYTLGLMFIGLWRKIRGDSAPKKEGAIKKEAKNFLKRYTGIIVKAVPILGSIYPAFIIMVYNELKE